MSQRLTMPFTRQMMLCGYKNPEYRAHWKKVYGMGPNDPYNHYGVDISTIQGKAGDDHRVLASGDGVVIDCGRDNSGGNVIIAKYPDCLNHSTGKSCDLVARYMHLASIAVKKGQAIRRGDVLGVEGDTPNIDDYHLHLEFDTDTAYPYHSPQVSNRDDGQSAASGNILLRGRREPSDTSVNPSHLLHVGPGQVVVKPTYNPEWLNPEDLTIPAAPTVDDTVPREDYDRALAERDAASAERDELRETIKRIGEIVDKCK